MTYSTVELSPHKGSFAQPIVNFPNWSCSGSRRPRPPARREWETKIALTFAAAEHFVLVVASGAERCRVEQAPSERASEQTVAVGIAGGGAAPASLSLSLTRSLAVVVM